MRRVLIAGYGSIGRRHLRNLIDLGVRDIALLRRSSEPVSDYPQIPVFTDLSKALERRPNLVLVCNPSAYHLDVALPAARGGCNLFIEKPLSNSWDGVEELLSVVSEKRLLAAVGFDLRFDPGLIKVKDLLEDHAIGRVVGIQSQVGQYLPDWRSSEDYRKGVSARADMGGGVILELIHELDYVTWLLGPVSEIFCLADKVSSLVMDTEDIAAMTLRFVSGAIGTLHLDCVQRTASRTCTIIGEEGTLLWDFVSQKVILLKPGKDSTQEFSYICFQRNERFREEMRHLLACVDGLEQPKVDVVAGSRSLKLALAAKQSARTGQVCRLD